MRLKNINYQLEKDAEKTKQEIQVLKNHVDHYKGKAVEWKTKYMKEFPKKVNKRTF